MFGWPVKAMTVVGAAVYHSVVVVVPSPPWLTGLMDPFCHFYRPGPGQAAVPQVVVNPRLQTAPFVPPRPGLGTLVSAVVLFGPSPVGERRLTQD